MTFQRIVVVLLIQVIVGLAGAFYLRTDTGTQLRTMKAFIEGSVFAEAVGACERAQSSTRSNGMEAQTSVIGLNSVKLDKYTSFRATPLSPTASLRLRPDREESRHRIELPRAGLKSAFGRVILA
jgi:hypothetical protein